MGYGLERNGAFYNFWLMEGIVLFLFDCVLYCIIELLIHARREPAPAV